MALVATLLCVIASGIWAEGSGTSAFTQGEAAFLRNKPEAALPFLEQAVREDPSNMTAVLYLGTACQQLNRLDQAVETFRKVLPRAGTFQAQFAFILGNLFFQKGSVAFADQYYSQALTLDPGYASAYLNRANMRVQSSALKEAVADYIRFLELEPASPKRPQIEALMAKIGEGIALEEQKKLAAEQAAAQEKLAQEQAAREDEARRKKLLDEVSASLQEASSETQGLQKGTDEMMQYDGEFELE